MKYILAILISVMGFGAFAGGINVQSNARSQKASILAAGHYYGVGWQRDGQHWSIDLLLNEDGGQIAYPSLECTGTWSFQTDTGDHLEYIEQILEGMDVCMEIGTVHVAQLNGGHLSYTWYKSDSTIEARALLIPVQEKRLSYMDQLLLTLDSIDTGFMYPEYIE